MRTPMRSGILVIIILLLCLAPAPLAQIGRTMQNDPADEKLREMQRIQEKARNSKRQADIKRDTDRLLQLSTELKAYVDKTNENMLSLDVIRKAEEIEKLSKEIQKKMRD